MIDLRTRAGRIALVFVLATLAITMGCSGNDSSGGVLPGPTCGDGTLDAINNETCDPPGAAGGVNGNLCRPDCTVCGDSRVDVGEACDDGNNLAGDGCENDCSPTPCLALTDTSQAFPGTVTLQTGPVQACGEVAVDVLVAGVDDVYTVSFVLQFDPAVVGFLNYDKTGSLLESDGQFIVVLANQFGNEISIAMTRLGPVPGIDVGPGTFLIRLFFEQLTDGESPLTFSGERINDSSATVIPGLTWFGGTLRPL